MKKRTKGKMIGATAVFGLAAVFHLVAAPVAIVGDGVAIALIARSAHKKNQRAKQPKQQ